LRSPARTGEGAPRRPARACGGLAESFGLDLAEMGIEVTAHAVVRDELLDRDPRILGR
jgi:hypothetical protein